MKGQFSSSTRMELGAWVMALTRNVPVHMGTDSESMRRKAMKMIELADAWTTDDRPGWWLKKNPFRKPWGLQPDGDLWELAWNAVLQRGPEAQTLSKVKGHATQSQVDEGVVAAEDKEGNDWADDFANRGAGQHQVHALKLARWLQQRHACYMKFMVRVHKCMAAVLGAEQN